MSLHVFAIVGKSGSSIDSVFNSISVTTWISEIEDVNVTDGIWACRCSADNVDMFLHKYGDSGHIVVLNEDDYDVLHNALTMERDSGHDYIGMCRRYVDETKAMQKLLRDYPWAMVLRECSPPSVVLRAISNFIKELNE